MGLQKARMSFISGSAHRNILIVEAYSKLVLSANTDKYIYESVVATWADRKNANRKINNDKL